MISARVERRWMLAIATAAALATFVLSAAGPARGEPTAGSAVDFAPPWEGQLRYAGEFGGFRLAAAAGYKGVMDVSRQQQPSPDIVFTSPGGIEPPPLGAPCIVQSADVVRCPLANLQSLLIQFEGGNDRLDTTRFSTPTNAGFDFDLAFRMGEGDDRYIGGPLAEDWFGGPGNDFAKTGAGGDRLIGQAGNDRMFGGLGIDFFSGGRGNDFARGGGGDDKGSGGPGDDNFKD